MKVNIFWFRRDLRLEDNTALHQALVSGLPVLPIFIFDKHILEDLPKDDARLNFIHHSLTGLDQSLKEQNSGVLCFYETPEVAFASLLKEYEINAVYANKDYEPVAIERDGRIKHLLEQNGISLNLYKDQVFYEENEVVKPDGKPYTVYTPYMRKWRERFLSESWEYKELSSEGQYLEHTKKLPGISDLGFNKSPIVVQPFQLKDLESYNDTRNIPSLDSTSKLSPHLRFGTVSIRKVLALALKRSDTFVNELIWREFFMQILYHFPHVIDRSFKSKYDNILWRNNEDEFMLWCEGKTGYPIVDAGMRELNATGYMHNRVRMITASFLVKHLLIDWRWGEAYFAEKLLDFELASNNGNWQWVAGTGCDAAPYFRVFNPYEQQKKFDPDYLYISKWVPEFEGSDYPQPMVNHPFARQRALETFAAGLK